MRRYKVPFSVACVGVVDLVSILVTAGKYAEFLGFSLNDADGGSGIPSSQQLVVKCFLLTGAIAGRTGGGAVTPIPDDTGDAVATSTARSGDTTVATGTAGAIGYQGGCYVTQGIVQVFPGSIPALGGELMVLRLMTAPSGTVTLSGTLDFAERGG